MATAIIHGMVRAKVCAAGDIIAACPEPDLLESLRETTAIRVVTSNEEAAASAGIIVLCVKPADVEVALAQAGRALEGKLLVSIVAGVTIAQLRSLAPSTRVIRVMPNTAAMIARSATAYACGEGVSSGDKEVAEAVFSSIGEVYPVGEKLMNAVTGLSGSGPAYVYLLLEALSDGGVACGLSRKLALDLAVQTMLGAAEMVRETSEHPAVLREMVTSPAGTTMAGLSVLEAAGVRSAVIEAVRAAAERAEELSGK